MAGKDPDSLNGEKLLLRTEYHSGSKVAVSKAIARRRTMEEEFAPQTQVVSGTSPFSIGDLFVARDDLPANMGD